MPMTGNGLQDYAQLEQHAEHRTHWQKGHILHIRGALLSDSRVRNLRTDLSDYINALTLPDESEISEVG